MLRLLGQKRLRVRTLLTVVRRRQPKCDKKSRGVPFEAQKLHSAGRALSPFVAQLPVTLYRGALTDLRIQMDIKHRVERLVAESISNDSNAIGGHPPG